MPTNKISLAELIQSSAAGAGTGAGPGAIGMGPIDVREPHLLSRPTVADLSECLFFSPGDGRIWLQDQRMVLMHAEAMGALRRELIESLGLETARGFLTRTGYVSGARDAQLVRRQWPDADPSASAVAGTRLHALEGMVKVEVVHVSWDPVTGHYDGEFLWHNSSEDDEHIAAYGVGGSPACWMQVGYATGYVSTLFGRLVLFREVACRSSGDAHCKVIGRSVELWDDADEDLRYLQVTGGPETTAPHAAPAWIGPEPSVGIDPTMVGASSAFNAAVHMLQRVAPTPATVLFTGESGVGKEMFAQSLHRASERRQQAFVALNCAAIPETLMESELFGVDKGAYTGAGASRAGRFERADGGTLFLDEIATLSLVAQGKLLRALQEGEIERVGGSKTLKVDVRVVAATNVNLRQAVVEGTFREDLFFRLNVFPIHLPPLRERRDDIPLLMQHFLTHYGKRYGRDVRGFTQHAVKTLFNYDYPGNIRELQNLMERAVIMVNDGELIDVHHLFRGGESLAPEVWSLASDTSAGGQAGHLVSAAASMKADPAGVPPPDNATLEQAEAALLRRALARTGRNVSAAARQLGITRATLAYRAAKYGLDLRK